MKTYSPEYIKRIGSIEHLRKIQDYVDIFKQKILKDDRIVMSPREREELVEKLHRFIFETIQTVMDDYEEKL